MSLFDLLPKDLTNEVFLYLDDSSSIKSFPLLSDKMLTRYCDKDNWQYLFKKKLGGTSASEKIEEDYISILETSNNFSNLDKKMKSKFISSLLEQKNYLVVKSLINKTNILANKIPDFCSALVLGTDYLIAKHVFEGDNDILPILLESDQGFTFFIVEMSLYIFTNNWNIPVEMFEKKCQPLLDRLKDIKNEQIFQRCLVFLCMSCAAYRPNITIGKVFYSYLSDNQKNKCIDALSKCFTDEIHKIDKLMS